MRTVEEQLQTALQLAGPLDPIELSVRDARGCVLATEVTSESAVPSADIAEFDGFAVIADSVAHATADAPVRLTVIDNISVGFTPSGDVGESDAVELTAGSAVPPGCDAVVSVGDVVVGDGEILVESPVESQAGVVPLGAVLPLGSSVLPAGTTLGEREIAAVAAAGCSRVRVHPHPRVVVITVGDNLVDIGRPISPGLEPDATSAMLMSCSQSAGADAFRGGPVPRQVRLFTQTVQDQLVRADLIVVAHDAQESSVDGSPDGFELALEKADCRDIEYCEIHPGGSIGVGVVGEDSVPLIIVDRSAMGAFVGFEVIIRPVIAALSGRTSLFRPVVRAKSAGPADSVANVRSFLPAVAVLNDDASVGVTALDLDVDSAAFWLHRANALMIVPERPAAVQKGDEVATIRLDRE